MFAERRGEQLGVFKPDTKRKQRAAVADDSMVRGRSRFAW
jgi:hypothetical protein